MGCTNDLSSRLVSSAKKTVYPSLSVSTLSSFPRSFRFPLPRSSPSLTLPLPLSPCSSPSPALISFCLLARRPRSSRFTLLSRLPLVSCLALSHLGLPNCVLLHSHHIYMFNPLSLAQLSLVSHSTLLLCVRHDTIKFLLLSSPLCSLVISCNLISCSLNSPLASHYLITVLSTLTIRGRC